jgi:hypothetical protein
MHAQTRMHMELRKGNIDRRHHTTDLAGNGRPMLKWILNMVESVEWIVLFAV